jgi:SAM-dependent methyltransferase
MLERLHDRFDSDPRVEIVDHDLELPLPAMGRFDAVVSSFAIHHLPHARKLSLYSEVWRILGTDGVFSNLEHVASPSEALHVKFLEAIGYTIEDEDPSNRLLDVETQLVWLRAIGFHEVDCYWKWRELALLAGRTNDQFPESVL